MSLRAATFLVIALAGLAFPAYAEKQIALSFDDVPRRTGPELSREDRQALLIGELKRAGVKQAAFFINPGKLNESGDALDARAITRYARAGHALGNHTANHPGLSQTSVEAYLADIDSAETWLKGRKGRRPWFRYPYLDEGRADAVKRDAVRAGLKARGLRNGYVTAESSDWHMQALWENAVSAGKSVDRGRLCAFYAGHHVAAAEFSETLLQQTLSRSPAQVLLLHETDLAAHCIGALVSAFRGSGWRIVKADKAYADPLGEEIATPPSAQGTITELLAWEKGLPAPRWYAYNDTDLLTADFNEKVLGESGAK